MFLELIKQKNDHVISYNSVNQDKRFVLKTPWHRKILHKCMVILWVKYDAPNKHILHYISTERWLEVQSSTVLNGPV